MEVWCRVIVVVSRSFTRNLTFSSSPWALFNRGACAPLCQGTRQSRWKVNGNNQRPLPSLLDSLRVGVLSEKAISTRTQLQTLGILSPTILFNIPPFPSFQICIKPVRKGLNAAYPSQLCVFKVSKGLITKWWQCHMVLVMARGIRWMQKRGGCEKDTEWQWGSEEAKNAKDSKTSVICNSLVFADCSWIKD